MSRSLLKTIIQPKTSSRDIELGQEDEWTTDEKDLLDTLSVIVEHSPVAIAMFDRSMHYLLANREWIREFNLGHVVPLVGKSQYEVFPKLHSGWRQLYEKALQGYTMRSDHRVLASSGGQAVLFRCEVRPWRQKHDASVGGVVVTCHKSPLHPDAQPEATAESPITEQTQEAALDLSACEVPIFLLDNHGRVLGANATAAEDSLARGLREGETLLWDLLGADEESRFSLRRNFQELVIRLARSPDIPPQMLAVRPLSKPTSEDVKERTSDTSHAIPGRWLVARQRGRENRLVAIGLSGLSLFDAATKPAPHTNGSTSPLAQRPMPSSNEDLAALKRDLEHTNQELRTLRETEKLLLRRERWLDSVIQSMPGGVLVLDDQGAALLQNDHVQRLLGRCIQPRELVEEWLGQACPDDLHRTQVQRIWREDIWRRQLTRTFSLVTADGLLKEIELRPALLPDHGLLIHLRDVTSLCRLEEQMTALESRYRALFHENPLAVVVTDRSGIVFDVNPLAEILLGKSKTELRRFSIDSWIDESDRGTLRNALREMKQSQTTSHQLHLRLSNGTFCQLRLVHLCTSNGEVHSTFHFFTPSPLSRGHRIQADPSPPTLQSPSWDSTPAPAKRISLLATNVHGRIVNWTEQATSLFGYPASEALGHPLHLLFQPSNPSGFYRETLREALSVGEATWVFFGRDGLHGSVRCRVRSGPHGPPQVELDLLPLD